MKEKKDGVKIKEGEKKEDEEKDRKNRYKDEVRKKE